MFAEASGFASARQRRKGEAVNPHLRVNVGRALVKSKLDLDC